MAKAKARRVDYSPDEYIAGVGGVLTAAQQGVYWMICTLIMSEGGAVQQDDRRLGGLLRMRPADVRKTIEGLVISGKLLRQNDGKLSQKRAQSEVEKSLKRIQIATENGSNGGRPAGKGQQNQEEPEPNGFSDGKTNYQLPTTNHQLEEKKERGGAAAPAELAFVGKVIRLDRKGFERWQGAYSAIPDLVAELTKADDYYSDNPPKDGKWFFAVSKWLEREHRAVQEKADEWDRREAEIYASLR